MSEASPAGITAGTVAQKIRVQYDDETPRNFALASIAWGIAGMLVGVVAALELAWFGANVHPALAFGRLRPVHTNAVIFAFVGNMIFAGVYHSTQRLVKARTASKTLSRVHFWGWQATILAAAISLPLGFTQAKEYAEFEWPIDLALTAIWIVFAVNFFWTLARRNEKHLYVSLWFYIATIVTVAILYVVDNLALPVFALKSYSVFGGAQDALVQWWYGHNAVAFVLTTPILGLMYYYVPKAAGRPVYSYRLSIIHFWALIFVYIWAGPHHLLNTALPDWAQTLGMIFSLMLWAPSWGGMLNGLFTLRGSWDKVRTDPVLKFFVAGLTFYGMATFEGPLLAIKSVSSLAHYTDWIIGHVHAGTLGWNGFMAAGVFYWLVPRLYGRELHSKRLADLHFYVGTLGILLYVVAMWVSGVTQGMMWRATNADGSLMYPTFVETLLAIKPMYWMRLVGGSLYFAGMVAMAYNLARTIAGGRVVVTEVEVVRLAPAEPELPWTEIVFGKPVIYVAVILALAAVFGVANAFTSPLVAIVAFAVVLGAVMSARASQAHGARQAWHRVLEGRALIFTAFSAIAVLIGGVAEIVPALVVEPAELASAGEGNGPRPYRALELEGRDVFIREGCYTCHSQMIRPLRFETQRYGAPSTLAESALDHPFQWGSKRTGPDLARVGGKYPNMWHYQHLMDPRAITPGSNMPPYAHLADEKVDLATTREKLRAMRSLGVPYTDAQIVSAADDARAEGAAVAADLETGGVTAAPDSRMVAVIAYLQRLGKTPESPAPAGVAMKASGASGASEAAR
jgi:cytochrome c oxidase cbb3-type subunit I/II